MTPRPAPSAFVAPALAELGDVEHRKHRCARPDGGHLLTPSRCVSLGLPGTARRVLQELLSASDQAFDDALTLVRDESAQRPTFTATASTPIGRGRKRRPLAAFGGVMPAILSTLLPGPPSCPPPVAASAAGRA